MLKRIFFSCLLSFLPMILLAVPVKHGVWQTITLADGTNVRVELRGDEFAHWWQAEDGTQYISNADGSFSIVRTDATSGAKRMRTVAQRRQQLVQKRKVSGDKSIFRGNKRGLIILADFPNQKFSYDNVNALYNRIANEQGYSDNGFNGSIRDYFIAQSGGQFTLDFDIAGPVTMSHDYSYYGQNNESKVPEMIKEACEGVDDDVDFSTYDWDGDGEVEEVFVLYAGHGQADYDQDNDDLIWPHMFWLSEGGIDLTLDNKKIDVYACSSELNGSGSIAGIGTFCHEFSHCMGFPDMYDTGKSGNYGMGSWDLMDYGSYNGNGYTPAGYSGYERMVCGWTNPIELTNDTTIENMQPLTDMGQSYIVYNQGNRNEYYILTNRQQRGYDSDIPGHGMLIEHIDYDQTIWENNVVNTTDNLDFPNSHQRITIFHANNNAGSKYAVRDYSAYPYNGNDSLTSKSLPAAMVYNANSDGSYYMNCVIRGITENSDGTMNFIFSNGIPSPVIPENGILFHETFDKCNGRGGNDGVFGGYAAIGYGKFEPDNEGWTLNYAYGADRCAKFNVSDTSVGIGGRSFYSPYFILNGDTVTLSFRAAAWNRDNNSLRIDLTNSNAKIIDDSELKMENKAWKTFTLRIVGTGSTRIIFTPGRRFFLDDVLVVDPKVAMGIKSVKAVRKQYDNRIYTISGLYAGNDLDALPKGIYIIGGKKVVR